MVDAKNSVDLRDLDHLDGILWGSNPNTRKGDLVLMYRTAPYSDIAYIFRAQSEPREKTQADQADMPYVIELGDKIRLQHPVTLKQMKANRALAEWSFARHQQGMMKRKKDIREEGYWKPLRNLIITRNKGLRTLIKRLEGQSQAQSLAKRTSSRMIRRLPQIRVFLSYSSGDRAKVHKLYRRLRSEKGIAPWIDKENLGAGDEWEPKIENEIRSSDAVIICLSSSSIRKAGVVQQEIRWALKVADRQPEGTTFIIPVKLEKCEIPGRLSRWQYVELFKPGGYQDILTGLRGRASYLQEGE